LKRQELLPMNITSNTNRSLHRVVVRLAIVMATISVARAQIIYSDGDFNPSNWTFGTSLTMGSGGSVNRATSGGNPGSYLRLTLSMSSGEGQVGIWGLNSAAVYNPATQGAIESIALSEDILEIGSPHAGGAVLMQNGLLYYRFTYIASGPSWITLSGGPGTATDYVLYPSPDNGITSPHPDFSILGAPITFGFYRNIGGTALTDFSTTAGLDNWKTTVNVVPEPSVVHLIAATAIALVAARFLKKLVPRRRRVAVRRGRRLL
jgi:hypothetical protein